MRTERMRSGPIGRSRALRVVGVGALAAGLTLVAPQPAHAAVSTNVNAGTLSVLANAGDPVLVDCDAGNVKVNGADPDNGAATCVSIDRIGVQAVGPFTNQIDLSRVDQAEFTALVVVNVDAGAGDDTIIGTPLRDTLVGGLGIDRITGGRGNDLKFGDGGDDTLIWNNGDGSDLMEGGSDNDTVQVNGAIADGDQFTVVPNGPRVRFDRVNLVPFNLDIGTTETLAMNGQGGDDTITGAVGLRGLITLTFDGGAGNDTLTGGDGDDTMTGGIGNDTLTGARGNDRKSGDADNDTLIWNNGDGSDLMEGAAGGDTVQVNGAIADGDQFTVVPNGPRVRFDRVNLVPFNLDIGTTETLAMNGQGGDDTITGAVGLRGLIALTFDGGAGNDTLTGGDGDDTMTGGIGNDTLTGARGNDRKSGDADNDTLIWNNGDGSDLMEGAAGDDSVQVNGAQTDPDRFRVGPNGARVLFQRTNLVPFSLDIGTSEALTVNSLGDDDVTAAAFGLGPLIDLAFDGGAGKDRLTGSNGDDILLGGGGDDRLDGKGGKDRLGGAGGDDKIIGGSGKDRLVGNNGRDRFKAGGGDDRLDTRGQRRERVDCGGGRDKVKGGNNDRTRANCEVVRA